MNLALALLVALMSATPPLLAAQPSQSKSRADAISHFQDRIKDYLALRDKVKASLAPPKPDESAQEVVARQRTFADAVRRARASAKEGDIFIAEVAPVLREIVKEDFRQRTPTQRKAALQEVPAGLGLKVNDEYPKEVPLATVPPKLLAALPPLPETLEYRFVAQRLILHDTLTNLVVDILEGAVPAA